MKNRKVTEMAISSGKTTDDTTTSECPPSSKSQEDQNAMRKIIKVRTPTTWLKKEDRKAIMGEQNTGFNRT